MEFNPTGNHGKKKIHRMQFNPIGNHQMHRMLLNPTGNHRKNRIHRMQFNLMGNHQMHMMQFRKLQEKPNSRDVIQSNRKLWEKSNSVNHGKSREKPNSRDVVQSNSKSREVKAKTKFMVCDSIQREIEN